MSSHLYCFLLNPGLPSLDTAVANYVDILITDDDIAEFFSKGYVFCVRCNIFIKREKKFYHCDDCDI